MVKVQRMTGRADYGDRRSFDPDATVALPVVRPEDNPFDRDATVVLPTVTSGPGGPGGSAGPGGPGGPPAGGGGPDEDDAGSVARNSAMMAVGSIVSRVTGFVRTVAIAAAIGGAAFADDYNLANTLPNMVYELLLGGVLSSVIVPLLVRARTTDADRGEAYTQRLLTAATVFLAGATVVAVLAAPVLATILARRAEDRHLVTVLGYLLLPEIFFYGVAALLAAVLNTRGHFAAPMWTPILNNVVVTLTAAVFALLPSADLLTPQNVTIAQILVLGIGTTLGIVIQATGLWPALRKVGFRWKWRWEIRELHLRELARISGWMLGYVLVSQIGVVVMLKLAKLAGDQAGPGPAIFLNSFLIFSMAHGIVAVSILTALMPRMSAAAAGKRWADLRDQLSAGTRLSAVILVPATAAYLVLGRPLGVTLFDWGRYGHHNAVATGWVIAAAGLGLVPFAISQLQLGAFYAMPDTRTPALINLPVVGLRILVQLLLYAVLPALWVAAGLMVGNTVSYLLAVAIGYWLLRQRIGALGLRRVGTTLLRLSAASAAGALPAALVVWGLFALLGDGKLANIAQLVVGGVVLVGGYVAVALAMRIEEVTELAGTLRARLGR